MEDLRERFEFQLDGVVFSLPVDTRKFFGENEHSPEWSIAVKFVPDEVVTGVTGIEWNIGKTGEFTPVVNSPGAARWDNRQARLWLQRRFCRQQ